MNTNMNNANQLESLTDEQVSILKKIFGDDNSDFSSREYWLDKISSILNWIDYGCENGDEIIPSTIELLNICEEQITYIANTITDEEMEEFYIDDVENILNMKESLENFVSEMSEEEE